MSRTDSQSFFNSSRQNQAYQLAKEVNHLLTATFHADLRAVTLILQNSKNPKAILSMSGDVDVFEGGVFLDGYSDIKRHGTALQLALQSRDIEMVELIASYLTPEEFHHQFKMIFGDDFVAFKTKQKEDAEKLFGLFGDFEAAFHGSSDILTQEQIPAFKITLENYLLENPTHNDFLLIKAYKIYEKNRGPQSNEALPLFSQYVIGFIQATAKITSPFRLQEYAQGIFYRAKKNEAPRRSYLLRDSTPDIRELNDCCIDIFGQVNVGCGRVHTPLVSLLVKLSYAENLSFQKLGIEQRRPAPLP